MAGRGTGTESSQPTTREKAAAARLAAQRTERQRRLLWLGGLVIAAVAAITIVILAVAIGSRPSPTSGPGKLPDPAPPSDTAMPPWPAPENPDRYIQAAGLRMDAMEGVVNHFHSHLDLLIDGAPSAVPPDIGVNVRTGRMSEMHSHDTRGVIHIEAPDDTKRYTLGQFFIEWNVRLTETSIGGLSAGDGKVLRAFVNGKQVAGDPAAIELLPKQEIALVFGPPGAKVSIPDSYRFQSGE